MAQSALFLAVSACAALVLQVCGSGTSSLNPQQPRLLSYQELHPHYPVTALTALPDKRLAAGTIAASISLFNTSSLAPHGPRDPYQKLQASEEARALAVLPNQGLAAGTDAATIDLFNASTLMPYGPQESYQKLQANGRVFALTFLENEGLAAGTTADTVDLFNASTLVPFGPRVPYHALQASGVVLSLVVLPNHGLAVGTSVGTIDIFNVSSLNVGGPSVPYQKLEASGQVTALAIWDNKYLAAGTFGATIDLFDLSDLVPQGPTNRYKSPYKTLQIQTSEPVGTLVLLKNSVLVAGTETDIELFNASHLLPDGPTAPYGQIDASVSGARDLAVFESTDLATTSGDRSNAIDLFSIISYFPPKENRQRANAAATREALRGSGFIAETASAGKESEGMMNIFL